LKAFQHLKPVLINSKPYYGNVPS